MMMKNKYLTLDFWRSFLYIFFGSMIFLILFYFRVIRTRIPRDLYTNISWVLVIIYVCMIMVFLYLIIKMIIKIKNGPKNQIIENEYLIKMISYINRIKKYFYTSLEELDSFLKAVILGEKYPQILMKISAFISKNIKFSYGRYFSWIFVFFPRIIISIVFFIDVVYFNYMEYFYKVLPLALIMLLYKYVIFCLRAFAEGNLKLHAKEIYLYEYKNNEFIKISTGDYVSRKFSEANRHTNSELMFQEEYLFGKNLEKFQFSFSEQTMKEEKEFFKYASFEEVDARLITYYFNMHRWWIYPEVLIYSSNMYKEEIDGPKFLLFTYCVYFMSWSYMLLYGITTAT